MPRIIYTEGTPQIGVHVRETVGGKTVDTIKIVSRGTPSCELPEEVVLSHLNGQPKMVNWRRVKESPPKPEKTKPAARETQAAKGGD